LGNLTIPIYERIKHRFITIEIDRDLVHYVLFFHSEIFKVVRILEFDIMKLHLGLLIKKSTKYRIFGSLPYNIAIPIMLKFLSRYENLFDMHFVLQEEIADRLTAKPNHKSYGRISVLFQYYFKIDRFFDISSKSFNPVPKVNSTFVRFRPHKNFYPSCEIDLLQLITRVAFHQRRKKILNSLKGLFSIDDYKKLHIDENMRAENLTVLDYCNLSNELSSKRRHDHFEE
ncbi:16S rRNA (adenine(1518)-N(6)/adenine(1519)-N(6))-dimethyltransferase RsmA, partial [Candidatus Riesia pediculischaeffi]|uniref:16S rRNA (adenine(1518)-N(6)/adenine(1519)-N(6))- dimethyltransferase RsmA n=1 Tax=Candidatus Riesia pediculischaeffi TaxID=428411 RepID=UPI0018D4574B